IAIALTAWLIAPAPMACTSTLCWLRMTPAMAPATETGLLVAETLRTSTSAALTCVDGCGISWDDASIAVTGDSPLIGGPSPDPAIRLLPADRAPRPHLAYSTLRVSRSTTTLIRPA